MSRDGDVGVLSGRLWGDWVVAVRLMRLTGE